MDDEKSGGAVVTLNSPADVEIFPKFSPDGKKAELTGRYDRKADAYVIPTAGGVPVHFTSHGLADHIIDWT